MIRRPHRSIEVFDISLMAVVTKAMGAFLVLMLLLMPYYSSGPVGEQNAAQLAQTITQAQKELDLAVQKLAQAKPDPNEIAKLLDEAMKRLREAQELMARLKRDNDALNGQVKRLEENLAEAKKENEDLEKQLADMSTLTMQAQLLSWDCPEVRMELSLLPRQDSYATKKGDKIRNVLNVSTPSVGDLVTVTDDDALAAFKDEKSLAPGHGHRFNQSTANSRISKGQNYVMAILLRDKTPRKIDGVDGYALKRLNKDCHAIVSTQYLKPDKEFQLTGFYAAEWQMAAASYGRVLRDVRDKGGDIELNEPSPETAAWFKALVDSATKEQASVAPAAGDRAALLKIVDAWTVPADTDVCTALTARATRMQVDAKAYNNDDRAGMAAVVADCKAGRFAPALQKLKAEMHRALK